MAHLWRGVIREYAARLPMLDGAPVVTLQEGGTPLIPCENLSELTGANVLVKFEGLNPTASFKDRGMTTAISVAKKHGARAVICASTGNTSASAAAYATKAGMTCAVLVPDGKIAMGKLSQAVAHGATLIQVEGNFDDCLTVARKLAEAYPVELVNSVNPARIEGQKTAAFEVVDALGDAPDIHVLPVGNAGNITAYWRGYTEYASPTPGLGGEVLAPVATRTPQMWGFQAAGAAPIVLGHPVDDPETIATAIRIGNPASWRQAEAARDESGGRIEAVTDEEILAAHRLLSSTEGIFVEPGSAASIAGLLKAHREGHDPAATPPSSAPSPATASRTRSGPCAPRTARRCSRCGCRSTPTASRRPWASRGDVSAERLRVGVGVEVRVPASSANLGPGFDSVGCALGVWDTCRATVTEQPGLVVTVTGEGAGAVPLDATHLVHRAMQVAWSELGVEPPAGPRARLPQRGAARPGDGVVRDRHRHRHRRRPGAARPVPGPRG